MHHKKCYIADSNGTRYHSLTAIKLGRLIGHWLPGTGYWVCTC